MKGRGLVGLAMALVVMGLTGCIGDWFSHETKPMLFFGEPVVAGDDSEIILSVSNMPDGGLSAIHVDLSGMVFDKDKVSDVDIEGLNGFIAVASGFGDGKGSFILLNIFAGVETGEIAKLTFTAHGNVQDGDFALNKPLIELVSDLLAPIVDWIVPTYYAR